MGARQVGKAVVMTCDSQTVRFGRKNVLTASKIVIPTRVDNKTVVKRRERRAKRGVDVFIVLSLGFRAPRIVREGAGSCPGPSPRCRWPGHGCGQGSRMSFRRACRGAATSRPPL